MTMGPSDDSQNDYKKDSNDNDAPARGNDDGQGSQGSSSDPQPSKKRKDRSLSDLEKIEERKAANRRSASESRNRRKALLIELQQSVDRLNEEKKELTAFNETMQLQLAVVTLENQRLRLILAQSLPQGLPFFPSVQQHPTATPAAVTLPTGVFDGVNQPSHVESGPPSGSAASQQTAHESMNNPLAMPGTLPAGVAPIVGHLPLLGTDNLLPLSMILPGMLSASTMPTVPTAQTLATGGGPSVNPPSALPETLFSSTGGGTNATQEGPSQQQNSAPESN